jgi:hypothetical protein
MIDYICKLKQKMYMQKIVPTPQLLNEEVVLEVFNDPQRLEVDDRLRR